MNDDELVRAVAAGDHIALRELFNRHAPWVAGRLRRVLPAHAVEDVIQETFIAVWRSARSFAADGEVGAWIWGIARRQAAMWSRKHQRPAPEWTLQAPSDPATRAIAKVDLQQALAEIGPEGSEPRELVRLMFLEDRPVAEIAERLGIPEGTVKSRVFRIRRLLRSALGGGEGER